MTRNWFITTLAIMALSILLVLREVASEWFSSNVDPKILLPVALTLVSATLASVIFNIRQTEIAARGGRFSSTTIASAISELAKSGKIKNMDVYAISSRHIHAQLVTSRISAINVRVLLWEPQYHHGKSVYQSFGREVSQVISSGWSSSSSESCFPRVSIKRYLEIPDIFYIIADGRLALLGFYLLNSDDNAVVDFNNVICVNESDSISRSLSLDVGNHFSAKWALATKAVEIKA